MQEEEKRLQNLKEELKDCLDIGESELIQYKESNILNFFNKKKEIDTQSTLSNYKKSLQSVKLTLREKEKELNILQNAFLSSQKEIEKLKKQNKSLEKSLQETSNREQLLLSNHSYYTSVRKSVIHSSVQHIFENYQIEFSKKLLNFYRENNTFLSANSGLFHQYGKDIIEYLSNKIGLEDDLKKEVSEEVYRQIQAQNFHTQLQTNVFNIVQKERKEAEEEEQRQSFRMKRRF